MIRRGQTTGSWGIRISELRISTRWQNAAWIFERGYVTAPLCRPSLASIVTGLYPHQHGVTGNDVDGRNNRAALDIPLRSAFHRHPSFVRLLTENGYAAHQSGKWWEGSYEDGAFTAGMTHGDPARGGRHGDAGLTIGRKGLQPVTEFIDECLSSNDPFFVWYAPFLPHTPHNPPERLLNKYSAEGRAADVAKYYAMCEWFDETCGQLLGHLESSGAADNTIVLYICDNGWAARSTNAADENQKAWGGFALRSKGSPFENGIRTPIMISWPGKVQPERVDALAQSIDLFPTIASAVGLPTPDRLPGIDLLNKEARNRRERLFGTMHSIHNVSIGNPDETLQYLWCVEKNWKLLLRFNGKDTTQYRRVHEWDRNPIRLYNLADDPHEKQDVAAANPNEVKRLKRLIEAWR